MYGVRDDTLQNLDRRTILAVGAVCAAAAVLVRVSSSTAKEKELNLPADQEFYDSLAKSTIQVVSGSSVGSGFVFRRSDIVVTNNHVIENAVQGNIAIVVRNTEVNEQRPATILSRSSDQDYAILRLEAALPDTMVPLDANPAAEVRRGTEIAFAGYPHGQPPLLVNKAWVSGTLGIEAFVIGGNFNAGNSGGPVVDRGTGKVLGIASARRFLGGPQMQEIKTEQDRLIAYLSSITGHGGVSIMGIDFASFAQVMAASLNHLQEAMILNANTGIGIVRGIGPVLASYQTLKI
jgi:S1-C subfamily serine protease